MMRLRIIDIIRILNIRYTIITVYVYIYINTRIRNKIKCIIQNKHMNNGTLILKY